MTTAIIVLGASVLPNGEPSPALVRRAEMGVGLQKKTGAVLIASGGVGVNPHSEAKVMSNLFVNHSVQSAKILLEDKSKNTLENLVNSFVIADKHGLKNFVIVSDFYHLPRIKLTAAFLKRKVRVVYPRIDSSKTPKYKIIRSCIRELVALPVYTLRLALRRIKN